MGSTETKSVDRALSVLDFLAESTEALPLGHIATHLGLPPSTVFRLLRALELRHYVRKEARGMYALGFKSAELGSSFAESLEIRAVARPFLERLRDETGETVHLATLVDGEAVYLDKVDSTRSIRMASRLGGRMPVHCTSLGKAILAYLPDLESALNGRPLVRRTPNTITSLSQLKIELATTRRRGYAIDEVENETGIRCVGAAIFDHTGTPAWAISVSGPEFLLSRNRAERLGPLLRSTADAISRQIGATPPESRSAASPGRPRPSVTRR